jgi:hypothetical protein
LVQFIHYVAGPSIIVSENPNSSSGIADNGFGRVFIVVATRGDLSAVLIVNVAPVKSPRTTSPTSK